MIKVIAHQNNKSKNGRLIILKLMVLKNIIQQIKNKYRIKPKRIFLLDGTELNSSNLELISDGCDIIFTTGGKYLAKNVSKKNNTVSIQLLSGNTYIPTDSISQLENIATSLSDAVYAFGMPDLHRGGKCPIGAVIMTSQYVYPSLIGTDIGCGMSLFQIGLKQSSFKAKKIMKKIKSIDYSIHLVGDIDDLDDILDKNEIKNRKFNDSLGTIGGGNHFAEFQVIDQIFNDELFKKYEFSLDFCYILVHSGSRSYGYDIAQQFHDKDLNKENLTEYLDCHNDALKWARVNRELICRRLVQQIKSNCSLNKKIDIFHNFVNLEEYKGQNLWIHRKGAASGLNELVIIPGSRGTHSYIVKPKNDINDHGLSLSHGAGRKISRSSTLQNKGNQKFLYNQFNSPLICDNADLIYQEAPKAYKTISNVIKDLEKYNLIDVIATLKPILTYKTKLGDNYFHSHK